MLICLQGRVQVPKCIAKGITDVGVVQNNWLPSCTFFPHLFLLHTSFSLAQGFHYIRWFPPSTDCPHSWYDTYIASVVDHTRPFVWEQYSQLTTNTAGIRSQFIIYKFFLQPEKQQFLATKCSSSLLCCLAFAIIKCLSAKHFLSFMAEKAEIQIYKRPKYPRTIQNMAF